MATKRRVLVGYLHSPTTGKNDEAREEHQGTRVVNEFDHFAKSTQLPARTCHCRLLPLRHIAGSCALSRGVPVAANLLITPIS